MLTGSSCSSEERLHLTDVELNLFPPTDAKLDLFTPTDAPLDFLPLNDAQLDHIVDVAKKAGDVAGEIIRRHYLSRGNVYKVSDTDVSLGAIMESEAEMAMMSLILEHLPGHNLYGKQSGWSNCSGQINPEFVWVLDPMNGEVEGLFPTFGTLIAVIHNGRPVVGCINNPISGIKTVGRRGQTTRNENRVKTRACEILGQAYLDIKDPGYNEDARDAYGRLAYKVGETFFDVNCISYSELAAGMLQVVVECAVEPYRVLALIPVVEGAGGIITDWQGNQLTWQPSPASSFPQDCVNVLAAADLKTHQQIIFELS